jgi:hypothetical protein
VWSFCQSSAVTLAVEGSDNWDNALDVIRRSYAHGLSYVAEVPSRLHRASGFLPLETAETICNDPDAFPLDILAHAQDRKKAAVGENLLAVANVAEREGWFDQLFAS